jgi:adenine/guanine phosphoribosyltransferase-like PRPP-binding protein
MTDNQIRLDEPLPEDVIAATRDIYAPPAGGAYWSALETRIMARISDSTAGRWWMVVGGWARSGLVAAAAVIVATVVGALLVQAHNQEVRTAYESATQPSITETLTVPEGALSERDGPDTRDATFRDVISH